MKRPDWDEYFLNIAKVVASRSSCMRRQVGAVIVHNKDIVSTGYNGAPQFQKNCLEIGYCYRDRNHILSGTRLENCRAVGSHAESNAIALAARNGHATSGSTIYISGHDFVCHQCRAQIVNANIERVLLEKPDGTIDEWRPEDDWKIHPVDEETYTC
ncbi:MAG: deaminase [Candidatus Marinimicrobia bacterium]|nr:deaminase [Candidatus Neomarinimicrobiota bacterium]